MSACPEPIRATPGFDVAKHGGAQFGAQGVKRRGAKNPGKCKWVVLDCFRAKRHIANGRSRLPSAICSRTRSGIRSNGEIALVHDAPAFSIAASMTAPSLDRSSKYRSGWAGWGDGPTAGQTDIAMMTGCIRHVQPIVKGQCLFIAARTSIWHPGGANTRLAIAAPVGPRSLVAREKSSICCCAERSSGTTILKTACLENSFDLILIDKTAGRAVASQVQEAEGLRCIPGRRQSLAAVRTRSSA